MLQDDHHNSRGSANGGNDVDATEVRDIHALTSPPQPSSLHLAPSRGGRSNSSSLSIGSIDAENFTTMSREFSALVVAGTTMQSDHSSTAPADAAPANLGRIGEDQEEMLLEETNPLAIVPDSNPIPSPRPAAAASSLVPSGSDDGSSSHTRAAAVEEMSVHRVKKEEVKSKIEAWQTAEIAKINNRFKREDVVINGWESEQVEKASAWLKKLEVSIADELEQEGSNQNLELKKNKFIFLSAPNEF